MTAPTKQPFNLKKYRAPELVTRASELFDVPGSFLHWLRSVAFAVIAGVVVVGILFRDNESSVLVGTIVSYGGIVGFVVGGLVGFARLLSAMFANIAALAQLSTEVVNVAAADFRDRKSGVEQPTSAQFIRAVYRDVTIPTIEQVLANRLWVAGKPLLWLHRKTLGRFIEFAIDRIPDRQILGEDGESQHEEFAAAVEQAATSKASVERRAARIESFAVWINHAIQRWMVRPLYFIAAILAFVLVVPLVVVYFA